jgi:coenzyme F420-0:L-glutamate ligase / coenzyme F420-1:gamma-L-glutamate ligase
MSLVLTPLSGIPLIAPGDDLGEILLKAVEESHQTLDDGDILVVAQKILSKSEGRFANLASIQASARARELAEATNKDARLIELILRESNEVLRYKPGTIIVEHRLGFICANAGIDHSNVSGEGEADEMWVLLLPENPDNSAEKLRSYLELQTGKKLGVLIIDSHGRAWREGTAGVAIGFSGMPGLVDLRGKPDLFGYTLRVTQVAVADELAAAASLMMGQADEGTPAVHVRGFPYTLREGSLHELLRPRGKDLFR